MIFFVIARAESPWRSTVFQKANRTYPYASIACSGLPRRSLRSLLAMTMSLVYRIAYLISPDLVIARA